MGSKKANKMTQCLVICKGFLGTCSFYLNRELWICHLQYTLAFTVISDMSWTSVRY